jgi:hypothetical protein
MGPRCHAQWGVRAHDPGQGKKPFSATDQPAVAEKLVLAEVSNAKDDET